MAERNISSTLKISLQNNEPFLYYHLVKFEKPKPSAAEGATTEKGTDYVYVTDAPHTVKWDDLSLDSQGLANGIQTYHANRILNIGTMQESTEARASTMSLTLSTIALGTTVTTPFQMIVTIDHSELSFGEVNLIELGFREGDKIKLELVANDWITGTPYSENDLAEYQGIIYACILTHADSTGKEPGTIGGASYWEQSNHDKYGRIDRFIGSGTYPLHANIIITPVDTGFRTDGITYSYTLTLVSEELTTLTSDKSATTYSNYVNREVYIYRAHTNPSTGVLIGDPFLLFKGIIAEGSIQESPHDTSTITWTISSHWGDFVRVQGRLTSDASHRALSLTGKTDTEALLRPEYATDYGFMHADRSVNVLGTYQTQELRYKMKKRGGLAGWLGGRKVKEYYETVNNDVDLRFNLTSKYLPIVYGVQKVSSIPIFADIDHLDPSEFFVAFALCEGEIGGIYDIHIEDQPSVCSDLEDWTVREPTHGGTATDEDSNVSVYCYGRSDRGDVLAGNSYISNTESTIPYSDGTDPDYTLYTGDGATWGRIPREIGRDIGDGVYAFSPLDNTPSPTGITHETSFTFTIPMDATFIAHTGKADQRANELLVDKANHREFKIQVDYYDGDSSNYWGTSHQLLDTAYVVGAFKLSEGEETIPQYDFVVKGKYIECYNYDFSYGKNPVHTSDDVANFMLGDTVTLSRRIPSTGVWEVAHANVQIKDKWYFYDNNKVQQWRFRWIYGTPATTFVDLTCSNDEIAKELKMEGGGNTWYMHTHEYATTEGDVISPPVVSATGAAYLDQSGVGELKITLDSGDPDYAALSALLSGTATSKEVYIGVSSDPTYSFLVTGYAAPVITLAPHTGAGYVLVNQLFGGQTKVFVANMAYLTTITNVKVGDTLDVYRVTNGIVETRQKTISYIYNNYAFTQSVYDPAFIPGLYSDYYTDLPDYDTYQAGPFNDMRVSINPAIQLLDYLTSTKYGRGLQIGKDLNLSSFLNSAKLCDDESKVTVVQLGSLTGVSIGDKFEYRRDDLGVPGGQPHLVFQGTVSSISSHNGYSQIVFDDVIGKLGYQWSDWRDFQIGDLIWGFDRAKVVTSGMLTGSKVTYASFIDDTTYPPIAIGNTYETIPLTECAPEQGSATISVSTERLGGLKNSNNIVRSWTADDNGFTSPGYTLHDSDEVKYWKYLGWEAPEQRFVTRHQLNQVVNTSTPIFDNINSMLIQFNGILRYSNGAYELDIKSGSAPVSDPYWETGINSLSEDDIIGDIKLDDKGQKNSYNSISANIIDPKNKFGARNISFFNSTYLKQDKGIPKQGTFAMPGISNFFSARTNIKQYLDESRYGLSISFKMDPKGYLLLAGEIIRINYNRFKWVNKLFRIDNLTLENSGLVQITATEHNDEAYLIDYSDRNSMDNNKDSTANPSPVLIQPPTGLAATQDLKGTIRLNWTHSSSYDTNIHWVEIWGVEATKDINGNYTHDIDPETYDGNDRALAIPLATIQSDAWPHTGFDEQSLHVYFYWVRYVRPASPRNPKSYYSPWEPLGVNLGVEGRALSASGADAYTIELLPNPIILQADSNGNIDPSAYVNTETTVKAWRGPLPLDAVTGTPGANQFSVTSQLLNGTIGIPGSGSAVGQTVSFAAMSNMTTSIANVKYNVKLESDTNILSVIQSITKNIKGADAWDIVGSNVEHIFIADAAGEVLTNDFSTFFDVSKAGEIYIWDNSNPYDLQSYRYGAVAGSGPEVVAQYDANGTITITGASTILNAGGPTSGYIDVPFLQYDGQAIYTRRISLKKVFSGIRGGQSFIFEESAYGAELTDAHVVSWTGTLDYTTAVAVAQLAINASLDGFIRPNDRITVTDNEANLAGTRIYTGNGTDNAATVTTGNFSSLVVETFSGSVIVDGTLSGDKLVADAGIFNNLLVGSNLVIGAQAPGPQAYAGQLYSYQKTSFGDSSPGFFMDHDGYFDVGDGSGYMRYDPGLGQVSIKGIVNITSGNAQIVTWNAYGTCTLDAYNNKVSKSGADTYDGSVISNTALGWGVTAVLNPANTYQALIFGLALNQNTGTFTGSDIDFGFRLDPGANLAYIREAGVESWGSFPYVTGDRLQVVYEGTSVRYMIGITTVATTTGHAAGGVYFWKGVFSTPGTDITQQIAIVEGAGSKGETGDTGADGADGADGAGAVTIHYTNSSHAVPVTNTNVETWTGSQGLFYVYDGASLLTLDSNTQTASAPLTVGRYNLNITPVSGNTLTEPNITGSGTTTASLGIWGSNLTTATVYRITAYIRDLGDTLYTLSQDVSLTPAFEGADGSNGADGADGDSAVSINHTNISHAVPVAISGVANWSGSQALFYAYDGASLLSLNTNTQTGSAPVTVGRYNLDINWVSGDTLTEPAITGAVGTTATLGVWAGTLTQATVYRVTAYIRDFGNTLYTLSVDVSLTPSKDGEYGSGMYSITSGTTSTAKDRITVSLINGQTGRSYGIKGDTCIVVASDGSQSSAYRLGPITTGAPRWTEANDINRNDWDPAGYFLDGDMVVTGSIDARELKISNLTAEGVQGIWMDGPNNCIKIYSGSQLRVKLGKLS